MDDRLIYEVLEVVGEIPSGKVATYGQIANLIGRPKNARLVGKILSQVETYGDYPCHRVVNASGRLVPGWFEQKALLEAGADVNLKTTEENTALGEILGYMKDNYFDFNKIPLIEELLKLLLKSGLKINDT